MKLRRSSRPDGPDVGLPHLMVGQGVANLAIPLLGGIPDTAAIAGAAVNVRSGASSGLAAVTHSVALLIVDLVASRGVSAIPLAALGSHHDEPVT